MSTEQIHEEMTQVMKRGGGLASVARAVDAMNFTLATHAAWTDERFERIDTRFEQVDRRFEQVDRRFEQIDRRFEQVDARFDRVDQRFEQVDQTLAEMNARLSGVEAGQSLIFNELQKMSVKMDKVLSFAITKEMKFDEIDE